MQKALHVAATTTVLSYIVIVDIVSPESRSQGVKVLCIRGTTDIIILIIIFWWAVLCILIGEPHHNFDHYLLGGCAVRFHRGTS